MNIWQNIKSEGFDHAIVFAVKNLPKEKIDTESFAEGDMNHLFAGVTSVMEANDSIYEFFSEVVAEVRKRKIKLDPTIN